MTNFPQQPLEYLWPILDAYLDYVRAYTQDPEWYPGPGLRPTWYSGARQLYEELRAQKVPEKESDMFVYWACEAMTHKGLINKSPGSLVWAVQHWQQLQRRQQRRTCLVCGRGLLECECEV